jgi:hypothetical protein
MSFGKRAPWEYRAAARRILEAEPALLEAGWTLPEIWAPVGSSEVPYWCTGLIEMWPVLRRQQAVGGSYGIGQAIGEVVFAARLASADERVARLEMPETGQTWTAQRWPGWERERCSEVGWRAMRRRAMEIRDAEGVDDAAKA